MSKSEFDLLIKFSALQIMEEHAVSMPGEQIVTSYLNLYPSTTLEHGLEWALYPLCSSTLQAVEFTCVKLFMVGHLCSKISKATH